MTPSPPPPMYRVIIKYTATSNSSSRHTNDDIDMRSFAMSRVRSGSFVFVYTVWYMTLPCKLWKCGRFGKKSATFRFHLVLWKVAFLIFAAVAIFLIGCITTIVNVASFIIYQTKIPDLLYIFGKDRLSISSFRKIPPPTIAMRKTYEEWRMVKNIVSTRSLVLLGRIPFFGLFYLKLDGDIWHVCPLAYLK